MTKPGLANVAARGAALSLTAQAVKFLVQVATLIVLAHLLSPSDFGLVSMVTTVVGVATLLSDFGLSLAAMQAKELSRAQRTNLFWFNVALGVSLTLITYFSAGAIASFYGRPEVLGLVHRLAPLFLIQSATTQFRAEAARGFSYRRLAFVDITAQTLGFAAALIVVAVGGGYWALAVQQLSVAAATLLLLVVVSPWRPSLPRRTAGMGKLLTFGVNTGGVQFLNYVTSNVDNLLLGRYRGAQVLGVYNQAYQLFRVPLQQLAAPMTQVAVPVLSRIEDEPTFERYVLRAQLVLNYLLSGAFLVSAAVAIPLFRVILGPGWEAAPRIFVILVVGGVFQVLGYVFYWIFLAKGLTGKQLRYSTLSRCLMVGFIAAGLPWGAYGVATGGSLGLFLNWLLLGIFVLPHANIALGKLVRQAVRPLALFGVIFAAVWPVSIWLEGRVAAIDSLGLLLVLAAAIIGAAYVMVRPIRADIAEIALTARLVRGGRAKPAAHAKAPSTGSPR